MVVLDGCFGWLFSVWFLDGCLQALIYNITVAAKSSSDKRSQAASEIMAGMKRHSPILVAEAELVSQELIRSAILWHEIWLDSINSASELFFGQKNIQVRRCYVR
jgi:FKBP12-rapamycin complex-associated protein